MKGYRIGRADWHFPDLAIFGRFPDPEMAEFGLNPDPELGKLWLNPDPDLSSFE